MKKQRVIGFRVTDNELSEIENAAHEVGKRVSDFSRDVVLAASDHEVIISNMNDKEIRVNPIRTKDIHLRISEEEFQFYQEQSQMAGCSVSEYIRRSANNNKIVLVPGLKETARQIAKLGANLNQLTVLAHTGKIKEVDLFPCTDTLKQILKELTKISRK